MKTTLLIGIIVCVLTLIGVLIHSIKKKSINLPEIIVGVTAAILSVLLAFTFSGETKENNETSINISNTESAILTTDGNGKTESTENSNEATSEQASEESNTSYTESVNENENDTQSTTDNTNDEHLNHTAESSSEQENKIKIVPLYETKTYLQEGSITREEITSDPRGNTYSNAYVFWAEYFSLNTGGGYYDKPYLEKYLGGKYSDLSLKIIPHKDFDKYNKNVEAYIKIYADEKLIYTSDSITRKTDCAEVSLSIENVNYLRIELNAGTDLTNYYNQYSVMVYDAKLTIK